MSSTTHLAKASLGLCVIIPTIGRTSIYSLVEDILIDARQSNIVNVKVIVALNGDANLELNDSKVHVDRLSRSHLGVARVVNASLRKIKQNDLTWTIADDERWLLGKFNADLSLWESHLEMQDNGIFLPLCRYEDAFGATIRPKIGFKNDESISNYLYGKKSILRNHRFMTLSGAFALRDVWLKINFPEDMNTREDIEYMIRQQELGTNFIQSNYLSVNINVDLTRGNSREMDLESTKQWINKRLNSHQICNFISGTLCKPIAASGNFFRIFVFLICPQNVFRDLNLSLLQKMKIVSHFCGWFVFAVVNAIIRKRTRKND